VKTEANCLSHALIIDIAKITNDPDYEAYIQDRNILRVVDNLLAKPGISLDNGNISELERFQEHFSKYHIAVYTGQNFDSIMCEGHVETSERINLL
jgi:hypothetical protein